MADCQISSLSLSLFSLLEGGVAQIVLASFLSPCSSRILADRVALAVPKFIGTVHVSRLCTFFCTLQLVAGTCTTNCRESRDDGSFTRLVRAS